MSVECELFVARCSFSEFVVFGCGLNDVSCVRVEVRVKVRVRV